MKKMIYSLVGRGVEYVQLMHFFMSSDQKYIFFDWTKTVGVASFDDGAMTELDCMLDNRRNTDGDSVYLVDYQRWEEALDGQKDAREALTIVIKTSDDYLAGTYDGSRYHWYRFNNIPIEPVDFIEVGKKEAFSVMLEILPRRHYTERYTWNFRELPGASDGSTDELEFGLYMACRDSKPCYIDPNLYATPFWVATDGAMTIYCSNGNEELKLKDVYALVWGGDKVVAIDFKQGCHDLGFYRQ